nr:amidohydrolase [uncultured Oscillibacter sp.]
MNIKELANKVQPEVVAFRRELHRRPEESFKEFETTNKIAAKLDGLGIPYRRLEPTGLLAELKGGKPGRTIVLRADIDALSVDEKTGLEFASEVPGMMHACGHDTHAAMLVGAAAVLDQVKEELCGTVRLLFQPAEEIAKGAKRVIEQGVLDGADMIFGIHILSQVPAGTIALRPGASASAADVFRVKVTGKSCHGAMPETGVDATVAASAIVLNLQSIVSRELSPMLPVVVTVGKLVSGSRFNVVSGEAVMEGTVRCFDPDVHHKLPEIVSRVVKDTASAYRCEAEVTYEMLTEVLMNDPAATALVKAAAQKAAAAPQMVVDAPQTMGAEDFADYTLLTTASFAMLGGGGTYPQHSDHFVIEEGAFPTGVALYAQVAADFLAQ